MWSDWRENDFEKVLHLTPFWNSEMAFGSLCNPSGCERDMTSFADKMYKSKFILFSDPLYQDSTFSLTTLNAEAKTNLPLYILDVTIETSTQLYKR